MNNLIDEPYRHRPHDLIDYTEAKINMLEEEFFIETTELDKARLRSCKNEFEVDRVARKIITEHWEAAIK